MEKNLKLFKSSKVRSQRSQSQEEKPATWKEQRHKEIKTSGRKHETEERKPHRQRTRKFTNHNSRRNHISSSGKIFSNKIPESCSYLPDTIPPPNVNQTMRIRCTNLTAMFALLFVFRFACQVFAFFRASSVFHKQSGTTNLCPVT